MSNRFTPGKVTLSIRNSIVFDPSGGTIDLCYKNVADGGDAAIISNGHNLASDASCGFTATGDQQNVSAADLKLGPLADNGGPTQTYALLPGSVAIDAGDTALTTDQRGVTRPQGAADDIGAFEAQPCTAGPWSVGTEAELNAAIFCYNNATTPGTYTINVTQNINLTAGTNVINNVTSGVNLDINGGGFSVDGQGLAGVRPFEVAANTFVDINELTITGGNIDTTGGEGGGILNRGDLILESVTVSGNSAQFGGGIRNDGGGLTIVDSTISGNSAPGAQGEGGGINNGNGGTMSLLNSTISGNTAGYSGAGISSQNARNTLRSATVAANSILPAATQLIGSGIHIGVWGSLEMRNTLVADNTGGSADLNLMFGTFVDGGHNLVESTSGRDTVVDGSNGNIVGVDPKLGPLADNGGDTQTHKLLSGSPAIDSGDTSLPADQRAKSRPFGSADDIGAYETHDLGIIIIEKITAPAGQGEFDFTNNISTTTAFTLAGGQVKAFLNFPAGSYTVTESVEADWHLVDLTCDDGSSRNPSSGNVATRTATIELDTAEEVRCTFTNAQDDLIIVQKLTDPPGGTGFDFALGGAATDTFTLDDTDLYSTTVVAGDYAITETASQPDYYLSSVECAVFGPNVDDFAVVPGDTTSGSVDLSLVSGQAAYCLYVNEKYSGLTVLKEPTPDDDGTLFDFELTGDATDTFQLNGTTNTSEFFLLRAGDYTVQEVNMPAGWGNDNIECDAVRDETRVAVDFQTLEADIQLAPGDDVVCTYSNGKHGSITIAKDVEPADPTEFLFGFDDGRGIQDFYLSVPVTPTKTFTDLPASTYVIGETLEPGWSLDAIECSSTLGTSRFDQLIDPATGLGLVEVVLAPQDDVTCTFDNEKNGSITVVKAADPADGTQFGFNIEGDYDAAFKYLQDGESLTLDDIAPGIYTADEVLPAGWLLSDVKCQSTLDTSAYAEAFGLDGVDILLEPGDDVTCTFTNTLQLGTIIIQKTSVPDKQGTFNFDGGTLGNFALKGGGKESFTRLTPGVYTVVEDDPSGAGFELSGLTCVDSDLTSVNGIVNGMSMGYPITRTASIFLDPGETVRCSFTNVEENTITVEKVTIPATSDSFSFDAGTLGTFTLRDGEVQPFANVAAGAYTITEDDPTPAGYALTDVYCVDSATGQTINGDVDTGSVDLTLTLGERIHCTFVNTQLGTVIIKKATAPAGGSGFSFSGDLGDFTLKDGGKEVIRNVQPGDYVVTENDPTATGYALSGISCVDSVKSGKRSIALVEDGEAFIALDPGETVTCTFTNSYDDYITVKKKTVPESTDSFNFSGTLGNFSVTAGSVKDFAVGAGKYTITEDNPAAAGYKLGYILCNVQTSGSDDFRGFFGNALTRSV
ncbi:MAG: hypothetical protein KDE20_06275, partial [Caldilineaceae bacterium]|nr:hypothetical protein [Caldilineaceae bacterium]